MKKFVVCFGSKKKIYHKFNEDVFHKTMCGIPTVLYEGNRSGKIVKYYNYPPKGYRMCKNCMKRNQ